MHLNVLSRLAPIWKTPKRCLIISLTEAARDFPSQIRVHAKSVHTDALSYEIQFYRCKSNNFFQKIKKLTSYLI